MSDFYRLSCPETGELLELRGRVFVLGRDEECDLQVQSKEASRRHLALEVDRGVLYVEDLLSANGTFVNGHRCRTRRALNSRDVLGVASTEYRVLGPGESDSLTKVSYRSSPMDSSFVTDEGDGDMTMIVGRYPLPSDWPERVEREIPENSLRGMERDLERRLLSDRLMGSELLAAFWHRKPGAGEDPLLQVSPTQDQSWTLGRAAGCALTFRDLSVSSTHARLDLDRSAWRITDLDSSNGTSINGKVIEGTSFLASGDVVGLGSVELVFRSLVKK